MTAGTATLLFLLILFLAYFVQSLVEAALGEPFGLIHNQNFLKWKPIILRYVAMLVGVGLSFHYSLDLINIVWTLLSESINLAVPIITASWVGYLLTGLGIGQGAIWLHELVKKILPNIPNRLGGT